MTPDRIQSLFMVSERWFLLSTALLAYARQMVKLEYTGAHASLCKAEQLEKLASAASFEVVRCLAEVQAMPESDARGALLRRLNMTLLVLVGLRLVALNVTLNLGARCKWLRALAEDFRQEDWSWSMTCAETVAGIDSS